jgi:hypothetical protein
MADSKGPSASGTPLPEMDPSGGIPSELGLNPSGSMPSRATSVLATDASRPPSSLAPTSVAAPAASSSGSSGTGEAKRVRVADPPDDAPADDGDEKRDIAPGQPGWADAADAVDSDTESVADLDPNHVRVGGMKQGKGREGSWTD